MGKSCESELSFIYDLLIYQLQSVDVTKLILKQKHETTQSNFSTK
jgi:hypothetical protein